MEDVGDVSTPISYDVQSMIMVLIAAAIVLVGYELLSRHIKRLCKKLKLEGHIENVMRLILRIVTVIVFLAVLSGIYGAPISVFLGGSALIGAVIGFGSSQTINNLVAGLYVIVTRPFTVKDYVKIGDIEGQVEEITFNYTKLYTPSMNLANVPNVQVMNSQIVNHTHEGLIKYNILLSLPHDIHVDQLARECLEPAIDIFYDRFKDDLIRKPEFYFDAPDQLKRSVRIRLFVPRGEAKKLYLLQPELIRGIISLWDTERKRS